MKTLQNLKSFCVQCVLFTLFVTPICYAVLLSTQISPSNTIPALGIVIWTLIITLLYRMRHQYVFAKDSIVLTVINLVVLTALLFSVILIPFAIYAFMIEAGRSLTEITAVMSVCFFLYRMRTKWIVVNE